MHDCIRSLVFRRFVWFLIIAFFFFSSPHVELIFPSISNLFVSDAYADTTNTPILGLVQKGRGGYYLAIGYDNDGNLLFNDRVELHTYWIKRKIMIPYNNRIHVVRRGGRIMTTCENHEEGPKALELLKEGVFSFIEK